MEQHELFAPSNRSENSPGDNTDPQPRREQVSACGPTRTKGFVRFRAAVRGIADIERALIGNVSI